MPSATWRGLASCAGLMLMGLVFVAGNVVNKHRLEVKRDRLHASGAAVTADIVKTRNLNGLQMRLVYEVEGKRYSPWIRCGTRRPPCEGGAGHDISIWTDRKKPSEFVAANGHTDNDIKLLDNWGIFGFGIVLVILGGAGFAVELPKAEPERRRRGRRVPR